MDKLQTDYDSPWKEAQETRNDQGARQAWKFKLTRGLYERGYEREDILNLFRFIDWVMGLPKDLEERFYQEVAEYEEKEHMPYITSVERIGFNRGIQQGIRQGLLAGIELGLELKFGTDGVRLLPEIYKIEDVDVLRAVHEGLKTASTLEELRRIYK